MNAMANRQVTMAALIVVLALGMVLAVRTEHVQAGTGGAALGDAVGNLSFKDIRYLPRSLDDFGEKKAYVLVFTNTTCPLVQRYMPRLKELDARYTAEGVQFVAVNVGAEDSIRDMSSHALEFEALFPFVKDVDGSVTKALGVRRTPEVVILDGQRRLVYRGRIDDQYRLGGARPNATRSDLETALSEVLAGSAVSIAETPVDGCLITLPEPPQVSEEVTFTNQISRIMQQRCQSCHRPNTAAPFSLVTYDEVSGMGEMVAEVVAEQRMPPWFASPRYGHFQNDPSLTRAERDLVVAWVRAGMPEGDRSALPEPLEFDDTRWTIAEPDLVISTPKEKEIAADGYLPYEYVVLPHLFMKETWLEAIEILPENAAVVHHCNMAYASGREQKAGAETFITGYVPGGQPMDLSRFGNNVAFKIPPYSILVLQIHYTTTGKPEKSRIHVGLRFPRYTVQKQLHHVILDDGKFRIEPHHAAYAVSDIKTVPEDFTLLGMFSHMHLRGKDMTFYAHLPDGTRETLLQIPNFNFDWQLGYELEAGKKQFPAGTRLEAVGHYDNSSFNPYNPDPSRTVPYGQQTYDEMLNGFCFFTYDNEDLNLTIDLRNGQVAQKPVESAGGQ